MEDLDSIGARRFAQADEAAEAHDRDPGRQGEDVIEVVADDDHREPLQDQVADHLLHACLLLETERGHRLVHDQQT